MTSVNFSKKTLLIVDLMQEWDLKQHRWRTLNMPPFSRNQTCTQDAFLSTSSEKINILEAAQVEQKYLFRLVGIGERNDHPNDIEVDEGSTGSESTGQDCCLAPGHLDTPRAL